ncbi:HEAT repeat domain-containing protein [Paenibacillus sp. GCM10027627]|uniref:HEAT repeat domain-containing protein n=1 Tax=unclassified Paenibacillus TaxID=185978 RepID=UPI00363B8E13
MSTALLQELHQEVRRLFIAGSDLAADDFRLKRLLPQFQQLGERAPIFKRLGEGIESVIDPSVQGTSTAAERLLDIGLLLGSVLRTLGTVTPEGELSAIVGFSNTLTTKHSYRKLAAVREAMTTTGGGRYEIIVDAYNEGMFQDLRLLNHAISALSDPYAEIAEFAEAYILPSYGEQIVSHLTGSFNLLGGKAETRKLRVLGKVGGDAALKLIVQASENGTEEIRAAAIRLFGSYPKYESDLLAWTKDKKKIIREAAYHALAEAGTPAAVERLYEAFSGKDIDIASEAARKCQSAEFDRKLIQLLVRELEQIAQELEAEEKKAKHWGESARIRMQCYLRALDGRQSAEMEDMYAYVVGKYDRFSSVGWSELFDHAADYLEKTGSRAALGLLYQLEQCNVTYLPNGFRASFRILSPEELFERYSVMNEDKPKSKVKATATRRYQIITAIRELVLSSEQRKYPAPWRDRAEPVTEIANILLPQDRIRTEWDERWLNWLIEKNEPLLVSVFAKPDHKACTEAILKGFKETLNLLGSSSDDLDVMLSGLERAEVPPAARWEVLVTVLEDLRNSGCYRIDEFIMDRIYTIPAFYKDRIAVIVPLYTYTAREQLQYVLDQMEEMSK